MAMDQWVATSHNKNQKGKKIKCQTLLLIKYNDVKSFNITHLDFLLESYIT